jgi:ParB/RepB/Spo0J family partition protein
MQTISISKLKPSNCLRTPDRLSEEFADLTASIRSQGILHPLLVKPNDDGTYSVIDGGHRLAGADQAGLSEVPCTIRALNDDDALDLAIQANIQRLEMRPATLAKAIQAMADRGASLQQIAARLNKSLGWLANILNLLRLKKNLAEEVDRGAINLGNAGWLTKLSVEDQRTFAAQAREQPTSAFSESVKAHLRGLREARDSKPFTPKPKLRSTAAIKSEYESFNHLADIVSAECHDAVKATLAWCLSLDETSLAEQREQFEKRKPKARELAA